MLQILKPAPQNRSRSCLIYLKPEQNKALKRGSGSCTAQVTLTPRFRVKITLSDWSGTRTHFWRLFLEVAFKLGRGPLLGNSQHFLFLYRKMACQSIITKPGYKNILLSTVLIFFISHCILASSYLQHPATSVTTRFLIQRLSPHCLLKALLKAESNRGLRPALKSASLRVWFVAKMIP